MIGFQHEAAKEACAKTECGNTGDAIQRSVEARLGITASAERQAKDENSQGEEKETGAIRFIEANLFEEQTQQAGPSPKPLRVLWEAQIGDEWGPRQEPSAPRSYLRHRLGRIAWASSRFLNGLAQRFAWVSIRLSEQPRVPIPRASEISTPPCRGQ